MKLSLALPVALAAAATALLAGCSAPTPEPAPLPVASSPAPTTEATTEAEELTEPSSPQQVEDFRNSLAESGWATEDQAFVLTLHADGTASTTDLTGEVATDNRWEADTHNTIYVTLALDSPDHSVELTAVIPDDEQTVAFTGTTYTHGLSIPTDLTLTRS